MQPEPAGGHSLKLLVFDLDGTLLDSLPDLLSAAQRMLAHFGLPLMTATDIRPMIGDGVFVLVERILKNAGDKAVSISLADASERYLEEYSSRSLEQSRLFPGTLEVLDKVAQDGWALAICTNKPTKAALSIVDKLQLSTRFLTVCGGDSFDARKPDPAHLLSTIKLCGAHPSRSIMIGDHQNDILAAKHGAVRSIFAEWGYGHKAMGNDATTRAATIDKLPELVNKVLESNQK